METLIVSVMPHAVGVALSPMPIAALIFILLSNRARVNSVSYLLGWFIGLVINVSIASLIFQGAHDLAGGKKSDILRITDLVLGIGLLCLAIKEWKSRPKNGAKIKTPKWLKGIENFSPTKSFLSSFLLVTINAKNTILDIDAGAIIGSASHSLPEAFGVIMVFAFIASLSISIPVFAFIFIGKRVDKKLNSLKFWFIRYNNVILFVLFLLLGVSLISKAI